MNRYTTYPELADRVGVWLKSVYRWRMRHPDTFPKAETCPECGHYPVVSRKDVDEWLRETGRMP